MGFVLLIDGMISGTNIQYEALKAHSQELKSRNSLHF